MNPRNPKMPFACLLLAFSVSAQAQHPDPQSVQPEHLLRLGSGSAPTNSPAPECPEYASKLASCSPYTCTFTHPITGARLQRKIIGLVGEKCRTVEAVPGQRTLTCDFPPETRKAVATFFKEIQAAETAGKEIGGTSSTTTVEGQPVVNPLQQALAAGVCEIRR